VSRYGTSVGKQTQGSEEMVYTINERQLLDIWTVVSCLEHVREILDPMARSELLTRAQIHLTALVLDLLPLPGRSGRVHPAEGI
jgi:hypothetical protein